MKALLRLSLLLLVSLSSLAQVNYQKRIKGGVVTYRAETVPGSMVFDGPALSSLPSGSVVAARMASRVGKLWLPEAQKRVFNSGQFGSSGTKSLYRLSCDFRIAELNHTAWRGLGFNMISAWTSNQADGTNQFSSVPTVEKLDYVTEGGLFSNPVAGGPRLAGHYYYTATLAQMEAAFIQNIQSYGPGAHWTANIEESNYWFWDFYDGTHANYPLWNDVKNQSIVLESTGETITLENLRANTDKRNLEEAVRRANRNSIMLLIAKRNGAYVAFGSSIWQGEPRTTSLETSDRYLDGIGADVSHIGGTSSGTITLNGRTYTGVTGSFYKHETFHLDYHYYFDPDIYSGTNYQSITDYPTLYQYVYYPGTIAREIGHWMANRKRLIDVHGGNGIPQVRMTELHSESYRAPVAMNIPQSDGGPAKMWLPPYVMRCMYMINHFLEGETAGAGMHIFHSAGAPNQGIEYNSSSSVRLNHHWHTLSALVAARRDMETIIDKLPGTTLTTDLDIKIGNTGSFQNYNAVWAYGFKPDGARNAPLPTFVTRHKTTSEGTYVLIMGGMEQDWNTTRTDVVRIPGVGNGNTIKITYKGRDLQVFEILFPNGVSNTEFTAQSIVTQWEKKGYGGRINNN